MSELDTSAILAEYERREKESDRLRAAKDRGEKIPYRMPSVEEELLSFRGYGVKYGQKALAELLGYQMDEKVLQMKKSGKTLDGYFGVIEQSILKILPEIERDPELKQIYEEALKEKGMSRKVFNSIANDPTWDDLPEAEKKNDGLLEKK